MKKFNLMIFALIFLLFSMPLASATVGDLVVNLGQNLVISSVPAIGQVYSLVQMAEQAATLAAAVTAGPAAIAALGGDFALSQLKSVGLNKLLGEKVISTISQVDSYGKLLQKGSEFQDLEIDKKTGLIINGSISIKQKDGTDKKINLKDVGLSVDDKTGISTFTFGEKGSLQVGNLKYENIKKGGVIKTDKEGNVVEASFTSSAASTYVFGKGEPLTVAGNTKVIYKDGVIDVYGSSFKYGDTQINNYDTSGEVSITVVKGERIKGGVHDLTTFSGKNFVVKGIKVYGDNGGIGTLSFEKVTFDTGYTYKIKYADTDEYGQVGYTIATPTNKPLTIERMVKASATTVEIPEGLKISGSEVIIGDTDYKNDGLKNNIYFTSRGTIGYVGTKGSSFSLEIQKDNKFGMPVNGKVQFTTRDDALSTVEISGDKENDQIAVVMDSSSGTIIDDGEGRIILSEGMVEAKAASVCHVYGETQDIMQCKKSWGNSTPMNIQVTDDFEQDCQKLGINPGNVEAPGGCKVKVSGSKNSLISVNEVDYLGIKTCAIPGGVTSLASTGKSILGKMVGMAVIDFVVGITGLAESGVVCKDTVSGGVIDTPEAFEARAKIESTNNEKGLAAKYYAQAGSLYANQAKEEKNPDKAMELNAKARDAFVSASDESISKSKKIITDIKKKLNEGGYKDISSLKKDVDYLTSVLKDASDQASFAGRSQMISVSSVYLNPEVGMDSLKKDLGAINTDSVKKIDDSFNYNDNRILPVKQEVVQLSYEQIEARKEAKLSEIKGLKTEVVSADFGWNPSKTREKALQRVMQGTQYYDANIAAVFDTFSPTYKAALTNIINGDPVRQDYATVIKNYPKAVEYLKSVGITLK